ncbi:MAG TPA: branched-chain amino acid transporter AzlC [Clostridiales bacterium]|jgi:4-azaleucine resistance transporter AzlC|nr:branched-chain amino acid transporter AzlC [Clostridiales bacterium]
MKQSPKQSTETTKKSAEAPTRRRITEFRQAARAALPLTLPVLTGFLFLGIAFGVLMQTKGYHVGWSVLMSICVFGGSIQFIAVTLLTVAFNPLQAFLMSLLVNARHLFYGLSMLDRYRGLGKIRAFLVFALCDETYSIVSSVAVPSTINKKYFYIIVSAADYLYWVIGTLCGGLLGRFVSFNTKGLDFVLTALFVVLFIEQFKTKENRLPGIIGLACTTVGLALAGPQNLILPSMGLILVSLLIMRKIQCS